MNRIDLSGLCADVPLAAMAAFGCLRLCERAAGFQGAKLSWEEQGGSYHAVLWTPGPDRDALIGMLRECVKGAAERVELTWSDQIKTATVETFVEKAGAAIRAATAGDRDTADWFAAFGSELVTDEGKLESTPFDMSVARQRFLADARKMMVALETAGDEAYEEALFGPWRYGDDQHSLGWDPSTMKLGAFSHKAPTAMANAGVRAAVWLAFESLPLFPCFYGRGFQTRGFRRERRELALCWPVWEAPLGLETVGSLLGWPELFAAQPRPEQLRARGVRAVFRSTRFKPNKYLASFRAAELVYGGVGG